MSPTIEPLRSSRASFLHGQALRFPPRKIRCITASRSVVLLAGQQIVSTTPQLADALLDPVE